MQAIGSQPPEADASLAGCAGRQQPEKPVFYTGFFSTVALLLTRKPAQNLRLAYKRQLDARERAPMGVPGKARGRRALLCARTNNAAWRVQRGVLGCIALSPFW